MEITPFIEKAVTFTECVINNDVTEIGEIRTLTKEFKNHQYIDLELATGPFSDDEKMIINMNIQEAKDLRDQLSIIIESMEK